jgi:SAM-dependent methyltransferase
VDLGTLQRDWDACGREDPLWAIIPRAGWELEPFFASGEADVALLMDQIAALRLDPPRGRALDFGCGVGRLTQALGRRYDEVVGVDIAPAMLSLAERHNRLGERCRYLLNETADLRQFPDGHFDLVCTLITLQHVHPRYAARYLAEFVRVLSPDGVAAFQLASHPRRALTRRRAQARRLAMAPLPERAARGLYRRLTGRPALIDMYGLPRTRAAALVEGAGGRLIAVVEDACAGEDWVSHRYFAARA